MLNDLAIVVHTCDKYEFCWDGWWKTFSRNWNFDLGIDIYFANEEKDVNFPKIKQLKTGKGTFTDRLRTAFNKIPHKYVIYWQEDMWMLEMIDNFEYHFNIFVEHNMDFLTFMYDVNKNYNNGFLKFHNESLNGEYLKYDIEKTPFVIVHQPTIYKKDFYLKYLQESETAEWSERDSTFMAKQDNYKKEIIGYNVIGLNYWYVPCCHSGKLVKYAENVVHGDFNISSHFKDIEIMDKDRIPVVFFNKPPKNKT